jgi:predicted TIM-barrel enzyme
MNVQGARHVVVVAGDRVPASDLAFALARRAEAGSIRVTVVCPISEPAGGLVVYDESRRDAARARLEVTLDAVRGVVHDAAGFVVEGGVENAARDAAAQLAPDELLVCTRLPRRRPFGRDAAQRLARATGLRVDVLVSDSEPGPGLPCVLAVAAGGAPSEALLARIRIRARLSPARFLIACPAETHDGPAVRREVQALRDTGIEAHAHLAHPDPHVAVLHAVQESRVDEVIVSIDSAATRRRGRALPHRISRATGLPVDTVLEEAA